MSDKMREEFEAWWVRSGNLVVKELDGEYSFQHMRYAWQAWQASRAAMVPDGWQLVPVEPTAYQVLVGRNANSYEGEICVAIYLAMLASAPKP